MSKVIVVYHSYRGVTEKLVRALQGGVEKAGGDCRVLRAVDAKPEDLLDTDVIVFASGKPFGTLAGPIKTFIEQCWVYDKKDSFEGKKYATIFNGSRDNAENVTAFMDTILPYFKLVKSAEGISCLAEEADNLLPSCEQLGEKLVRRDK